MSITVQDVQIQVVDSDESDEEEDDGAPVRTALIDEKSAAVHLVGTLAASVPTLILPNLVEILGQLDKVWTHFHPHLRCEAVITYESFMTNLKDHCNATEMFNQYVWPKFESSILKDEDVRVVKQIYESLMEIVKS